MSWLPYMRLRTMVFALLTVSPLIASDHADPMSLNVLKPFLEKESNLTDLHAFVDGDRLVVTLCARNALKPGQAAALHLDGYTFKVHMDFKAEVQNKPACKADEAIIARYGGIIRKPEDIVSEASLSCRLRTTKNSGIMVESSKAEGFYAPLLTLGEGGQPSGDTSICFHAGIFDDPFIFPLFFRSNVVGMIWSIPLNALPPHDGPILLWGSSHDPSGKQIDHVGRSLRSQLPRFNYLSKLHPREHRAAIIERHEHPSLVTDLSRTGIAPLLAHRYYDIAPDVMIYDLSLPARFPNGRKHSDDVASILAESGETMLLELSYADSRQFPRSTVNDKPFRKSFPYLAPPWTDEEIEATHDDYPLPADAEAAARPDYRPETWRKLLGLVAIPMVLFAGLSAWLSPNRVFLIVVGVVFLSAIIPLLTLLAPADLDNPSQPIHRVIYLAIGSVVLLLFALSSAWLMGRSATLRKIEQ